MYESSMKVIERIYKLYIKLYRIVNTMNDANEVL